MFKRESKEMLLGGGGLGLCFWFLVLLFWSGFLFLVMVDTIGVVEDLFKEHEC